MDKAKFIKTSDPLVADQLRKLHFTELTESGTKGYCFINNGLIVFDENLVDTSKIQYTNIMCL